MGWWTAFCTPLHSSVSRTYVYAVIKRDGRDGEPVEVFQGVTDEPLTKHPETGEPVRRLVVTPQFQTQTDKGRFSKKNLD